MLIVFIFASFNSIFFGNLPYGNFGIINKPYFSFNLNRNNIKGKFNKENLCLPLYGGCSLTVECKTVALEARVRLPPSAFKLFEKDIPKTRTK